MNLAKHSLINFASQVIAFIFSLITSIILARTLGPQGKGIYFLVFMIATTGVSLVSSSIPVAGVYYIGIKKYRLEEIVSNFIILAILLGSIGIGLVFIFFKPISTYLLKDINPLFVKVALLFIPLHLLMISMSWIFLGMDDIPKYNLINVIRAVMAMIFIITVSLFSRNILWYIIANLSALGVAAFLAIALLFNYLKKGFKLNLHLIKDVLIYGWKGHFGEVLFNIVNRLDSYLVKIFLGITFLGYYSVSLITEYLWYIPMSIGAALFPKISSSIIEDKEKETATACRNAVFLTYSAAFIFFILSNPLVRFLYGERFLPAVLPLCILLPGVASLSISKTLKAYLSGIGRPKIATYSSMLTILVSVSLNLILIPRIGIAGAALATSLSYFIYSGFILIVFLKLSGNKLTDTVILKRQDLRAYRNFVLRLHKGIRSKVF